MQIQAAHDAGWEQRQRYLQHNALLSESQQKTNMPTTGNEIDVHDDVLPATEIRLPRCYKGPIGYSHDVFARFDCELVRRAPRPADVNFGFVRIKNDSIKILGKECFDLDGASVTGRVARYY